MPGNRDQIQDPNQDQNPDEVEVEPYKLSEIFSIVPEYDGNQIFLQTFLNSVKCAFDMAIGNQKTLLTLHVKNKLRGKAAEIVNSRNPATWNEIKHLLDTHFGDSRDLTSLIQDLQRISQQTNESALNFVSRLQTHNAKMHAAVQKQQLTADQKLSQSNLIETMTLNTLLTGLDPKLGSIIRASNPRDMLSAISRIKRELQLSYFESQKFSRNNNANTVRKPNITNVNPKTCSICKRNGHVANECRMRQQNYVRPNFQNFSSPSHQINFSPNHTANQNQSFQPRQFSQPQNQFQRPQFNQNQNQQNRPSTIRPNPNFNPQRPQIIRPNPNFNQSRAHHVNLDNFNQNYYSQDFSNCYYENPQDTSYGTQYDETQPNQESYYPNNDNYYDDQNQPYDNYVDEYQNFATGSIDTAQYQSIDTAQYQNFQLNPIQDHPPDQQICEIQTQIRAMNLNNPKHHQQEQSFI